ncbi:unnamed protein product, partial [Didymodactylos carnosus]
PQCSDKKTGIISIFRNLEPNSIIATPSRMTASLSTTTAAVTPSTTPELQPFRKLLPFISENNHNNHRYPLSTQKPSGQAVTYPTLSLMTKVGTTGKQLIEQQHVKMKMKQVLRWALLLLMLIMFGGALISRETTSNDSNYGYIDIELLLFGIDINLVFEHGDHFIPGLLDDNKIKLLNHWNWFWLYTVP